MICYTRKDGQISAYELSCGGTHRIENNEYSIELWMEHSCYHVRLIGPENKREWYSFHSSELRALKSARKKFSSLNKVYLK